MGAKGATDLASANELGIRELDGESTPELVKSWRDTAARNRDDFRTRDGSEIDSSVGAYPARWQAFHLAFELATHADDVGVAVTSEEAASRNAWQARFGRFALKESKPDVDIEAHDGHTRVRSADVDADLSDEQFVQALAARVPPGSLDEKVAAALSVTP
jgi:hypothetical protein